MILAIDTTGEHGSLALARGAEIVEEVAVDSADGFGHILFGEIDGLLRRNGLRVGEVECFAAASGPGSFTGVRIGLACVKGLAHATGKPVVGVSNLQALAVFGSGPLRAVWIDARRGEIYGAVYDARLGVVCPEVVTKFDAWRASLPAGVEMIAGEGRILAGAVARIAAQRLAAGETGDAAGLDANYVRRSDAELFWKEP